MKQYGIIGGIAVIVLVGGIWMSNGLSEKSTDESVDESEDSILSRNGIHYHPQLEIYIHGEKQDIPANIGLVGVHSPIHTHDADGIIHLEYEKGVVYGDDTKLGNFFRIWDKEFNSNQVFNYTNGPDGNVFMTVNDEPNEEFENYEMKDGDRIEIRYEKLEAL